MQFDAVMHAGPKKAENREETHKKTGTHDASFFTLRKGDITQDSPIMWNRKRLFTFNLFNQLIHVLSVYFIPINSSKDCR